MKEFMDIDNSEKRAKLTLDSAMLVNVSYEKTKPFANINFKSADIVRYTIDTVKEAIKNGTLPKNDGSVSDDYHLYETLVHYIEGTTFTCEPLKIDAQNTNKALTNIFNDNLLASGILKKKQKYDIERSDELKYLMIKLIEESNKKENPNASEYLSKDLQDKKEAIAGTIKSYYDLMGKSDAKFEGLSGILEEMTDTLLNTQKTRFPSRLLRKYINGIPSPLENAKPEDKIYATVDRQGFVSITEYPTKKIPDNAILDQIDSKTGRIKNRWVEIDNSDKEKSTISFQVIKTNDPFPTLHVVFRGTDTGKDIGQSKLGMENYLSQDYFKMDAQYKKMKPFIDDAIAYQMLVHNRNPANKDTPLNVNFTGHSLGAAYAHIALEDNLRNGNETISTARLNNNGSPLAKLEEPYVEGKVTYTGNSFNIPPILKDNLGTKVLGSVVTNGYKLAKNGAFYALGISAATIAFSCSPALIVPTLAATGIIALKGLAFGSGVCFADYFTTKPYQDLCKNDFAINSNGTIFQKEYDIVNLLSRITCRTTPFFTKSFKGSGSYLGGLKDHDMRTMGKDIIEEYKNGGLVNFFKEEVFSNQAKLKESIIDKIQNLRDSFSAREDANRLKMS